MTLERQCWANAQYSRKECVQVVGSPRQVDGKHLEAKVMSIFQKVGCTIAPEFIDDRHRIVFSAVIVIPKYFLNIIRNVDLKVTETLLYGDSSSDDTNKTLIMNATMEFLIASKRFDMSLV